ncbi:MAG: hypothetical protein ACOVOV_04630 [Dolichospermum sp.]
MQNTYNGILIKNPFSEKTVDVYPLLNAMSENGDRSISTGVRDTRRKLEEVARFITLHTDKAMIQDCTEIFQEHCFFLYKLADAIDKMENF